MLIPACCFLLIFLLLYRRSAEEGWREAFLTAAVLCGLLVVTATELLSLFNLIVFPVVLGCWIVLLLVVAALCYRSFRSTDSRQLVPAFDAGRFSKVLVAGIVLYVVWIAVIAIIAPPNTWDSLEYHMPKVAHWIQNHNIDFFPTAIPRQNHQNPGAEYFILHFQLLSGSDRFANLVEWFSMVGSLISASLIARVLGATIPAQVVAAAFAVSMPMGIMQASSTQTDYVIAFWLSCFVYFMLRLIRSKTVNWEYLLVLSVALGLAVFAKATAYIYATPFLCWMVFSLFRSRRAMAVKPLLVCAAILLAINSGHYLRNYDLHGNPLGPGEEPIANSKYSNDTVAPPAIASNVLRNITTHTQTPWPAVNTALEGVVIGIHDLIGIDVNDSRTTWGPFKYSIRTTSYHDEIDGNPLHLVVVLFCCLALLLSSRLRKHSDLVKYTLCTVVTFLLFAIYIKWSPFNSRVHLSTFLLAAPVCAVILTAGRRRYAANIVALVLLVAGIPWVLNCTLRPLTGPDSIFKASRVSTFFNNPSRQNFEQWFGNGDAFLKDRNFKDVGLIMTNSSWEYIWWVLLKEQNSDVRIEHVNVADVSNRIYKQPPFAGFQPDTVISLVPETSQLPRIEVNDVVYSREWNEEELSIFLRR